jgi:hypothetical protein
MAASSFRNLRERAVRYRGARKRKTNGSVRPRASCDDEPQSGGGRLRQIDFECLAHVQEILNTVMSFQPFELVAVRP